MKISKKITARVVMALALVGMLGFSASTQAASVSVISGPYSINSTASNTVNQSVPSSIYNSSGNYVPTASPNYNNWQQYYNWYCWKYYPLYYNQMHNTGSGNSYNHNPTTYHNPTTTPSYVHTSTSTQSQNQSQTQTQNHGQTQSQNQTQSQTQNNQAHNQSQSQSQQQSQSSSHGGSQTQTQSQSQSQSQGHVPYVHYPNYNNQPNYYIQNGELIDPPIYVY